MATGPVELIIPTFNRPQVLRASVESALAETSFDITVLDDHSDEPVASTLADVTDERLRVIRNVCNLGAGLNILRSLEVSRAQYTWVFADDHVVSRTAETEILDQIRQRPDAAILFWHTAMPAEKELDTCSLEPFIELIEYGNMAYGQTDRFYNRVVSTDVARRYLRLDARFSHAQPFLGIQIAALQDGHRMYMQQGALAIEQTDAVSSWNTGYSQRFRFDVYNLIRDPKLRARYRAVAARQFPWRAALIDLPSNEHGTLEDEYAQDAARLLKRSRVPLALRLEAAAALWVRTSWLGRLVRRIVPAKGSGRQQGVGW